MKSPAGRGADSIDLGSGNDYVHWASGADEQHLAVEQFLLAVGTDLGDQKVSRIALLIRGIE